MNIKSILSKIEIEIESKQTSLSGYLTTLE